MTVTFIFQFVEQISGRRRRFLFPLLSFYRPHNNNAVLNRKLHYRHHSSTELHYVRGRSSVQFFRSAVAIRAQCRGTIRRNHQSRSSMPPPCCRTVLMFCLAACRVMDSIYCLVLIHDDGLDLMQPNSRLELWMAAVLDDAHHLYCSSPITFTTFRVSAEAATIDIQQHLAGVRELDGVVLAAARCQVADLIESVLSSTTPILRLDFMPCPSAVFGMKDERLELYRLDDTRRDYCGSYAFKMWLEHRICFTSLDNDTQRLLLDKAPFNVSRELQDCSSLDDLEWVQSVHPIMLDVADSISLQSISGKKLRLASLERPPFVIFERYSNGTVSGYKGYCYEIIHVLQNLYNFTYEVDWPKDNAYGKELSNGQWNGMIGMIVNKIVDIGVGPFSVTHSRARAVGFSVAFYEDPAAILIPPPAEDNRLLVCTKPFRLEVWLSLMSFAIILPAVLWQHLKFVWINYRKAVDSRRINDPGSILEERRPILARQYFFVLGVLIGQSGQLRQISSIGYSPRILGAVWCLGAVVFASAYVGVLMSFLSFPKLSPIISRLEELPQSKLKWGVQRGTALESLFIEATSGIYKTIGEALLHQPGALVDINEDGIRRVANGSYAYIKEKSYLEFAVDEDFVNWRTCRLSIAKQEFFKVNFAFAIPTASPLKTVLDKKILQMLEAGLGEHWKKRYWPSNKKCDNVKRSERPKSLKLADLQGAFFILAIGSGSALVIFILEGFILLMRNIFIGKRNWSLDI